MKKLFEKANLLERINNLIRTKSTGTPLQLAKKLGCCERALYDKIEELRSCGFPIEYDHERKCYYYTKEVKINFSITVDNQKLLEIKGGYTHYLLPPQLNRIYTFFSY